MQRSTDLGTSATSKGRFPGRRTHIPDPLPSRRPVASGWYISAQFDQLEARTYEKFTVVFNAIRKLMMLPGLKNRRSIGSTATIEK